MKEGKVNMCRAIREMLEDERAEGNASGIIKTARRYHASDEEIIHQLMEGLEIDKDKAKEYLAEIS
ncbi:MAG: hypothetical protein IJZ53_03775 [Tyzzerella sp.]|nr:hypothetical protein [Tyzzerella sp.]